MMGLSPTNTPVPLPVARILIGAVAIPWTCARSFARALALPAVVLFAATALGRLAEAEKMLSARALLALTTAGATAVFAVICHRLVLLADRPGDENRPGPLSLRRILRYVGWVLVIALVYFVLSVPLGRILVEVLQGDSTASASPGTGALVVFYIFPLYVVARLMLVLPGAAMDQEVNLRWSWALTRGNGWRLFVAIFLFPWSISVGLDQLTEAGAPVGVVLLGSAVETLLYVVEVAALSLAYRELRRWPPARPSE